MQKPIKKLFTCRCYGIWLPVLAVLCAGCGRQDSQERRPSSVEINTAEPSSDTCNITFWHIMNYAGPREILADAVNRFEKANPNTKVQIQTFENDAYKTKLAIEMAGGTPPDVLFTWGGGPLTELGSFGKVLELSDFLNKDGWRNRFIDQALNICSSDGNIYGVPLDLSLVLLWYNRHLFEQSGVQPPGTFQELLELCGKLNQQHIVPLSLGNMKQWPGAFYFVYLATRAGGTPLFLDAAAGKPGFSFADPAFVRAGAAVQKLISADAFAV